VLLADGKVAGLWEKQKKGDRIEVRVEPFGKLDKLQKAQLEEEARRIGAILGQDADLATGQVSIRPHL